MLHSFEPQTSKVFKYDVIIYQCWIISFPVIIKDEKKTLKDGGEIWYQVYQRLWNNISQRMTDLMTVCQYSW